MIPKTIPSNLARLVIPTGVIAVSLWAFWLSTQFDRVPPILKRGMQPEDFPQLVIGLIICLAVLLIFTDSDPAPAALSRIVQSTMALLVGFVLIAEIDLFLGLGLFAAALSALWGERRTSALLFVGVVAPLLVFILFDGIFEIRFPRGVLTTLWYG